MAASIMIFDQDLLRLNNFYLTVLYEAVMHAFKEKNINDTEIENFLDQLYLASLGIDLEITKYIVNIHTAAVFSEILRKAIRLICGIYKDEKEITEELKKIYIGFYANIKKYELYLKSKEIEHLDYWDVAVNDARIFCKANKIFTTDFIRFDFFYETLISVAKIDDLPLSTALNNIFDQFKNCGNGIDFDIANYLKTYEDTIILLYAIAQSTLEFCLIYPPLTQEGIKLSLLYMLMQVKEYGSNLPQTGTISLERLREYEKLIPFK